MRRQHLTSSEAAWMMQVDPRSWTRWARAHGLQPVRRQRVGRSTVTLWAVADLRRVARGA